MDFNTTIATITASKRLVNAIYEIKNRLSIRLSKKLNVIGLG